MTSVQKVTVMTRLTGWGLQRCGLGITHIPEYTACQAKFKTDFDYPDHGRTSGSRLLTLKQGNYLAAEYSIKFQILPAKSGWNEPILAAVYRKGLSPELQLVLACRDEGFSLYRLITHTIKLDQHHRSKFTSPIQKPQKPQLRHIRLQSLSKLGKSKLTPHERQEGLCLYCGWVDTW